MQSKNITYFRALMNIVTLLDSIRTYLVSEGKNKRVYQLPEAIALRIDLAGIRAQYPQTTLVFDHDTAFGLLTVG